MSTYIYIFLLSLAISSSPAAAAPSRSSGGFGLASLQRKDDQSARWTLAGWLEQKKSFRAMDHWLAMNRTIDRFELGLGGAQQNYSLVIPDTPNQHEETDLWRASLYWSIFGLDYEFEDSSEKYNRDVSQFNLRLFGTSSQVTNLVVFGGLRRWKFEDTKTQVDQSVAGGSLTLYLFNFLGVEGKYQKFFAGKDENKKEFYGDKHKYSVFLDLSILRIYGATIAEKNNTKDALGVTASENRTGVEIGAQLFL